MDKKINGIKRSFVQPFCKYGLACYRENPEHRKKFKHSSKDDDDCKDINMNILDKENATVTTNITDSVIANITEDSLVCEEVESNDLSSKNTVEQILKMMPNDFFDFWDFCWSLKKSNPENAFIEFGYKLVGVYDLFAKNVLKHKKVDISCHWRYFYDPPEFQTVIMKDGIKLYHIGYFRDDPSEKACVLASNCAAVDAKLTLMGDNIFAAMNSELKKCVVTHKSKANVLSKLQKKLREYASRKKYSLENQTERTKQRQKKVVAKTFHGFGIVVPVKNDIGYRPLPDSNSQLKNILKKVVSAENEAKRLEEEEKLDEILTNVQFANDECDYGMGLELGIDLFCYGHTYLHDHILSILPLAYKLLKRPEYESIIRAHLKNRKKNSPLRTLDL